MSTPISTGLLYFIPALGIAIFLHEGGHFLTAKLFGMKVERFFIGFGPTLWSWRRGETEYGVKLLIPVGGFCKIAGMSPYEDDANFLESERRRPGEPVPEPTPPERQFRNKPAWQRAIVLAAGSATHFVVGCLLIYAILVIVGLPSPTGTNEVGEVVATVPESSQVSPARAAGLRSGDRIVSVDGKPVGSFADLHDSLVGTAGRNVPLVYERDGQQHTVTVHPATITRDGQQVAFLGVDSTHVTTRLGPLEGVPESLQWFGRLTAMSFAGLGSVFSGFADRLAGGDEGPQGIVGITRTAGYAIESGLFVNYLLLLVQFNIFVGIANLLPIPPLDGGYLAFLAKEKLTGRPVDLRKVAPVAALIIVLLVMFTAGVLWLDVTKPIGNPFG